MNKQQLIEEVVNTKLRQHFDSLIEQGDEYELNYFRRTDTQDYWRREWRRDIELVVNLIESMGLAVVPADTIVQVGQPFSSTV